MSYDFGWALSRRLNLINQITWNRVWGDDLNQGANAFQEAFKRITINNFKRTVSVWWEFFLKKSQTANSVNENSVLTKTIFFCPGRPWFNFECYFIWYKKTLQMKRKQLAKRQATTTRTIGNNGWNSYSSFWGLITRPQLMPSASTTTSSVKLLIFGWK